MTGRSPIDEASVQELIWDVVGRGGRATFLHLLCCPACREKATALLLEKPSRSRKKELSARIGKVFDELEAQRALAEGLVEELLRSSPRQRRRRVRAERFHTPGVAAMLLTRSYEAQLTDPKERLPFV